jgi:hypothetical protein
VELRENAVSIGLAIFASVVLLLLVYHDRFRKVFLWLASSAAVLLGLCILVRYLHGLYEGRAQAKLQAEDR